MLYDSVETVYIKLQNRIRSPHVINENLNSQTFFLFGEEFLLFNSVVGAKYNMAFSLKFEYPMLLYPFLLFHVISHE